MVIREPVPYGQDSLNNSPLENDGSDFPCKQRAGVYDITKMNNMPVGVPQSLAFMGGATHGGGSCQISVTLDKEPTKDSEWKVIHSIIGGCPSNATGNLSGNSKGTDASVFQYSIPKGMPNGQYTLAWTWFNKIGNREMYMNCAPIKVTGGADNNDVYDELPTMFVANLPREECSIGDSQDFVFPEPGRYVETCEKTALGSSTSGAGCASVMAKGAGAGNAAKPTGYGGSEGPTTERPQPTGYGAAASGPIPTPGPEATPKSADNAPTSSAIPVQAVPSSAAEVVQPAANACKNVTVHETMTVTQIVTSSGAAQQTKANFVQAARNEDSDAPSGNCAGGAVACPEDGRVVCIGQGQWGKCDAGCAEPMSLTEGTECRGGSIARRSHKPHLARHVHHRHSF